MEEHKDSVLGILGIALLGLCAWFIYKLLSLFLVTLKDADPKIAAAIIGSVATVIVGLCAVLYTQKQIKQRDIDEAHREKKVAMYSEFLNIVQRTMSGQNKNVPVKPISDKQLLTSLLKFKTEIMLWSSPGVINSFVQFQEISAARSSIDKLLPAVEKLYREMRKDIGLKNSGLPDNQLVKMYLKDPSELDDALKDSGEEL